MVAMKRVSLMLIGFLGVFLAVGNAFSQVTPNNPAPSASGKVGIVNTLAFTDESPAGGIAKLKAAIKLLNDEFKPAANELNTLLSKHQALKAELEIWRAKGSGVVPARDVEAKSNELAELEKTFKRKQEDNKAAYEKRYPQVVGPVSAEIFKALNDFAKQRGFAVIFDGVRLEQQEILIGFDEKYDVTKDFIAFFNARAAAPSPK